MERPVLVVQPCREPRRRARPGTSDTTNTHTVVAVVVLADTLLPPAPTAPAAGEVWTAGPRRRWRRRGPLLLIGGWPEQGVEVVELQGGCRGEGRESGLVVPSERLPDSENRLRLCVK